MEQRRKQRSLVQDSLPPSYLTALDLLPSPPTSATAEHDQSGTENPKERLLAMGFSEEWAKIALRRTNGNIDEAIAFCIESGALETTSSVMQSDNNVVSKRQQNNNKKKKKKKSMWLFGSKKMANEPDRNSDRSGSSPSLRKQLQEVQEKSQCNDYDSFGSHSPSELPSYDDVASNSGVQDFSRENLIEEDGNAEDSLPTYDELELPSYEEQMYIQNKNTVETNISPIGSDKEELPGLVIPGTPRGSIQLIQTAPSDRNVEYMERQKGRQLARPSSGRPPLISSLSNKKEFLILSHEPQILGHKSTITSGDCEESFQTNSERESKNIPNVHHDNGDAAAMHQVAEVTESNALKPVGPHHTNIEKLNSISSDKTEENNHTEVISEEALGNWSKKINEEVSRDDESEVVGANFSSPPSAKSVTTSCVVDKSKVVEGCRNSNSSTPLNTGNVEKLPVEYMLSPKMTEKEFFNLLSSPKSRGDSSKKLSVQTREVHAEIDNKGDCCQDSHEDEALDISLDRNVTKTNLSLTDSDGVKSPKHEEGTREDTTADCVNNSLIGRSDTVLTSKMSEEEFVNLLTTQTSIDERLATKINRTSLLPNNESVMDKNVDQGMNVDVLTFENQRHAVTDVKLSEKAESTSESSPPPYDQVILLNRKDSRNDVGSQGVELTDKMSEQEFLSLLSDPASKHDESIDTCENVTKKKSGQATDIISSLSPHENYDDRSSDYMLSPRMSEQEFLNLLSDPSPNNGKRTPKTFDQSSSHASLESGRLDESGYTACVKDDGKFSKRKRRDYKAGSGNREVNASHTFPPSVVDMPSPRDKITHNSRTTSPPSTTRLSKSEHQRSFGDNFEENLESLSADLRLDNRSSNETCTLNPSTAFSTSRDVVSLQTSRCDISDSSGPSYYDDSIDRSNACSNDESTNTTTLPSHDINVNDIPNHTVNVETRNPTSVTLTTAPLPTAGSNNVDTDNLANNRPPALSETTRVPSQVLPSAIAVSQCDEDDMGTVHGEAYVQLLSGEGAVSQLAQSDLYVRDDRGRVFVAVAAPLTLEDDNVQEQVEVSSHTDDAGSSGSGLFSNVRTRLYGSSERQSSEGIGFKRRVFLGFDVAERGGQFYPTIHLLQPKLGPNSGPQAGRPISLKLPPSTDRAMAVRHAEVNTPPMWAGRDDPRECSICGHSAGMLFKVHHCRNCGYYVCNKCSKKDWPSSMLPRTFVPEKEKIVRICDSCAYVQEGFVDALRAGDVRKALAFFSTGNVNLHNPMSIYKSEEFPIHAAVEGGSIHLVRWLLEDRKCSIYSGANRAPIKTAEGLTCLAIAAYFGHGDIMRYLVHNNGAQVTEITEAAVLVRGLHALLEAPGNLPELPAGKRGRFFGGRRAVPRELEEDRESTPPSNDRRTAVTATIATGNRHIDQIVSTTAHVSAERNRDTPLLRPKRAIGKRRSFDPNATLGIRQQLEQRALDVSGLTTSTMPNISPFMEEMLREAAASQGGRVDSMEARQGLSHANQGLAASTSSSYVVPYEDDDIRSLTPEEMARYRQFNARNTTQNDTTLTSSTGTEREVSQQEYDNIRAEAEHFSFQRQESDALEVERVLRMSARMTSRNTNLST